MDTLDSGLILFLGNDESPMNYSDNTYRYRQDSTFLYYFGIQRPGLKALLDVDGGNQILFGDAYTVEDSVWMGPQPTLFDHALQCGLKDVRKSSELAEILKDALASDRTVHFLPPYRSKNQILLHHLIDVPVAKVPDHASTELIQAVIAQREHKTDQEIRQLHEAVDISVDMHVAAMRCVRPGLTEAQVASEIHKTALAAGGDIAFPIIATINGQTLHNHFHGNTLTEDDLFLIDAGFENKMGYAGDLSSTIPVSGHYNGRQREIYQLTLASHQAAIDRVELGEPFLKVHLAACEAIFEGLKSVGITKGDTKEAVAEGAHALFFPCGTGHMMGLDVHDMEDLGETWVGYNGLDKSSQFGLKSLRLAKPLEEGHVFTIEPGIYFIPELIDLWQSQNRFKAFINYQALQDYRSFGGIRNEEDFVMTKNGAELLGKPKPKTISEIEAICSA